MLWSADPFEPLSRPPLILGSAARPNRSPSRQIELRDRYLDLGRPYPSAYTQ